MFGDADNTGCGVLIGLVAIGAGDAGPFFFFFFFFLQPLGFDLHDFGAGEACGWAAPEAMGSGVRWAGAGVVCPIATPSARRTVAARRQSA